MKLKTFIKSVLASDGVKRVFHTAWQAGVPVLLSQLVLVHSTADVKGVFIVTGAAVLAAVKALLVSRS